MTDSCNENLKCRKCGKASIKLLDDSSGICLNCNDAFANIAEYRKKPDVFTKRNNVQANIIPQQKKSSKMKGAFETLELIEKGYILFGVLFIIISMWHLLLSRINSVFPSHIISFLICSYLFFVASKASTDKEYKQAFTYSLMILILFLIQGIYYIYVGWIAFFESFCIVPLFFLFFVAFGTFYFFLRYKI